MKILIIVLGLLTATTAGADRGEVTVRLPRTDGKTVDTSNPFDVGNTYVRLEAEEFGIIELPGEPMLPCRQIVVVLPPEADPKSVKVKLTNESFQRDVLEHDIVPAPPYQSDTNVVWGSGKIIEKGRNHQVYSTDAYYPSEHLRLLAVGQMRRWQLATVRYHPCRYNPVTRELVRLVDADLVVSFERSALVAAILPQTDMAERLFRPLLESVAVNYEEADAWYENGAQATDVPDAISPTYAIITRSEIVAGSTNLARFVTRRKAAGYQVRVVTETDWGGGTGDTAAEHIRGWLRNNWGPLNICYALLLGDPTNRVPMKQCWPHYTELLPGHGGPAPNDLYYSDLTGNWDLNGDGIYGDALLDLGVGGVDVYPEVYVGRIPYYGNMADLDAILEKTINYHPDMAAWQNRAILAMNPTFDPDPYSHDLGEAIKSNVLQPVGVTYTRIYDQTYGLNPPPELIPCNHANVLAAWQQGAGYVFWNAHGNTTLAADIINSSQCGLLDDTRPSFTFQSSCNNGYPEAPDNLGYSLLKHGAIATISAARTSWGGTTDYGQSDRSEGLAYRYAYQLVRVGWVCGAALSWAKQAVAPSEPYGWDNTCNYNLYGDPLVGLYEPLLCGLVSDSSKPWGSYFRLTCDVTVEAGRTLTFPSPCWVDFGHGLKITAANGSPSGLLDISKTSAHSPAHLFSIGTRNGIRADGQIHVMNGGSIKLY